MSAEVVPLHRLPLTAEAEEESPSAARPDDLRMWSVTTIAKTIQSGNEGLMTWGCNRAADCALDEGAVWENMVRVGQREEARKYIAGARWRPRPGQTLKDSELGTMFHSLAERWIVDGKRPRHCGVEVVELLLDSFGVWLDAVQPAYEAAELTVYSPTYGYAGTLDGIAKIKGTRFVIDYKTSLDSFTPKGDRKAPFPDVALQLAGYRWAEFAAVWRARRYEVYSRRYYLLSPEERTLALPVPEVDHGLVVHVAPDHCDSYPVNCGRDVFEDGFLVALDAASWVYRHADDVIDMDHAVLMNTRRA